jgi:HSP20 family molecular chaperone IbpA
MSGALALPAVPAVSDELELDRLSEMGSMIGFGENASHYLVRFAMPRFLGDEVTIEVANDELVVKGRYRRRRSDGPASSVSLRIETEQPGVLARYENGILVVALPKRPIERAVAVAVGA